MWLINCYTYALEYFNDPEDAVFPKGVDGKGYDGYLILSHTWGDTEVSFHEAHDIRVTRQKKGFRKIESMCKAARQESYGYVWVDTCCIDKSSSAELTESINSMFRWYREADCCVVYLEDLAPGEGDATEEELRPCRWFTRGWTLQELIAPGEIKFVDASWTLRGTKETLFAALHNITGIDNMVLRSSYNLDRVAVARRMSWAASRETTRIEDKAYCLMGIFGVNMPLIYGEREMAFIRLQETIAQQSDDLSLFAW
ncbi:heterokaryon incompatibility protein-domain-containing protein, partial [Lasiosphaeris hirsuta]